MHLLVVDDDSVTRMTMRTLLTSEGHSVTLAVDGEDALLKLTEEKFDLIVTDVVMPVMDGYRLRDAVRTMPEFAHLPILFMSGCNIDAKSEPVKDTRVEGFFRKGKPLIEFLAWLKYLTTPVHKRSSVHPNFIAAPPNRVRGTSGSDHPRPM